MRSVLPFVVLFACGGRVEPGSGLEPPDPGSGCTDAKSHVLVTGQGAGDVYGRLAFAGDEIVYGDFGTRTLQVVSKQGGDPVAVAPCADFAMDGNVAFCTDRSTLFRVPMDGTAMTTLASNLALNNGLTMVAGDGHIYMSDFHTIWSFDETDGTSVMLTSAPSIWLDAFDAGTLFWHSDSGGYGAPIVAINATVAATNVTTTLTTINAYVNQLKLNQTSIYFLGRDPNAPSDPNNPTQDVYVLPRAGGDANVLIAGVYSSSDFAVDDSMIIAIRLQVGYVVFDLAGQELRKANVDLAMDFALFDGPYIYWVTGRSLSSGNLISRACR